MEPQGGPEYAGGLTFNLKLLRADEAYEALIVQEGLEPLIPLEDHAYGDRGFWVSDLIGVRLYCDHDLPPSAEFAACFRTPAAP